MKNKIDFVIIWVDHNDPQWITDFHKYRPQSIATDDSSPARYRDWENLKYWFRGVETFAPWVNKVHLVTCGHYPSWLNTNAPKLNLVRHGDYIPKEYLPVFSSNPIEIHLHKIPGLAEKFVYFNDDFFLTNDITPEHFFKNGLPCDMAVCTTGSPVNFMMSHIQVNNMCCINRVFRKHDVIRKNWNKWFNLKYGSKILRSICLLPFPHFTLLYNPHLPSAFLKDTFISVWLHFENELKRTSQSRFRSIADNNQYLFRDWQLVTGKFHPLNTCRGGKYFEISDENISMIEQTIKLKTYNLITLNDSNSLKNFEKAKQRINAAFEEILPYPSSFEL